MEIIFSLFALFMLSTVLWKHRKKITKALAKRKPKPEPLPAPQKTLKEVNDADHAFWLEQYKAILQVNCDHLYHSQSWYTCRICGQEEPWEYTADCSCRVETLYVMGEAKPVYALQRRSPSCTVHGKDYKMMPLSDRKAGPFGGSRDWNDERPYQLSKERFKGRVWKDLVLPTREGSN